MKLGTVSLWCLCCGREMRYYNFISVVVIFPLKKKSVFLLSWTGPVKPALFFERSFFRQKSPGSPDGPHKKLSWKHGFVNQFTTSWKAFPPNWFFWNQSCVVCALQYSWDCLFLGGFGFVTFADRKPTAWRKLDVFSLFPFFQVVAETLTLHSSLSHICVWKYLRCYLTSILKKVFPFQSIFSCLRNIVSTVK